MRQEDEGTETKYYEIDRGERLISRVLVKIDSSTSSIMFSRSSEGSNLCANMIVKNREMILYLLFACNAVIIMSTACADQRERERERESGSDGCALEPGTSAHIQSFYRCVAEQAAAPPREADAHGGIPGRGSDAGQAAR